MVTRGGVRRGIRGEIEVVVQERYIVVMCSPRCGCCGVVVVVDESTTHVFGISTAHIEGHCTVAG